VDADDYNATAIPMTAVDAAADAEHED